MTALRTVVGACNKYVKALKKILAVKRGGRRRRGRPDAVDDRDNCYDNEAADNAINELIDSRRRAAAAAAAAAETACEGPTG